MSSWDNGLRAEANVCLFVIGSSFHRAFAAHRRADGHYLLYERFNPTETNGIIRKFPSFDFSLTCGKGMEKDESGDKKLWCPLLGGERASSFSLSQSRFVIENVDGLIFCDVSFRFFSRKVRKGWKQKAVGFFSLFRQVSIETFHWVNERFIYSSTCTFLKRKEW